MTAKVIAVFNQCGGVAKTTSTMNLGYALAQMGKRVLLIDIDPQADLTDFMGLDPDSLDHTVYHSISLHGDKEVPLPITKDLYGMDLVPANIDLSAAEMEMIGDEMRGIRLREAIEPIKNQYDFILVDCPPALGILSVISLAAADWALVPVKTEYKSRRGTAQVLKTIKRIQARSNKSLKIIGFLPTIYRSGVGQHDRGLTAMRDHLSCHAQVFAPVPMRTGFSDASEMNEPLGVFNPQCDALESLNKVADYLIKEALDGILV